MGDAGPAAGQPIAGRLVLAPNPCTTEPCLPGVALAIDLDQRLCFLIRHGSWLRDSDLGPDDVDVGDEVWVTGRLAEAVDVRGEPYLTAEVASISHVSGAS